MTLRDRYLKRETAPTTFGPKPVLGLDVEQVFVDFCKVQHARGFSVPKVFIVAQAKKPLLTLAVSTRPRPSAAKSGTRPS